VVLILPVLACCSCCCSAYILPVPAAMRSGLIPFRILLCYLQPLGSTGVSQPCSVGSTISYPLFQEAGTPHGHQALVLTETCYHRGSVFCPRVVAVLVGLGIWKIPARCQLFPFTLLLAIGFRGGVSLAAKAALSFRWWGTVLAAMVIVGAVPDLTAFFLCSGRGSTASMPRRIAGPPTGFRSVAVHLLHGRRAFSMFTGATPHDGSWWPALALMESRRSSLACLW